MTFMRNTAVGERGRITRLTTTMNDDEEPKFQPSTGYDFMGPALRTTLMGGLQDKRVISQPLPRRSAGFTGDQATKEKTPQHLRPIDDFLSEMISYTSERDNVKLNDRGDLTCNVLEWSSSSSVAGSLLLYSLILACDGSEHVRLIYIYPSCYSPKSMKELRAEFSSDGTKVILTCPKPKKEWRNSMK